MRAPELRFAALAAAIVTSIPLTAHAQLEEIVVTATRRETDLQSTPLSIQAFTAQQLELGGITNGRDLGIMVPNVVLNPGTGGAQSNFYIRGLPGVGLYVDGVWTDGFGFQQMNFDEMERVEVLRGPQGTLFGRNTNGGAVNMTTRKPADEFGARVKLNLGQFNRRDASLAVDLPVTEKLKTKFMAATAKNDGFLKGLTTPWDFGSEDDTLLRGDLLFEPTDRFTMRFTINDEKKRGTDPKIHRMTRYDNSKVYAYNIMLGAFQAAADARCVQLNNVAPVPAGTPTAFAGAYGCSNGHWSAPPPNTFGMRYTGVKPPAFNPATHTTNYPNGFVGFTQSRYGNFATQLNAAGQLVETLGSTYTPNPYLPDISFGPGQVGKWETKSDSMQDGITADLRYSTLTMDWDINDKLHLQSIMSDWKQHQRQVVDYDGTEFLVTTDDIPQIQHNQSLELHLTGKALNDRINWLAGYYRLNLDNMQRFYRWGMWEFVNAGAVTTTSNPTTGQAVPPPGNVAYEEYVRQTAFLLNLNGFAGGNMLTTGGALYPWALTAISDDSLTDAWDKDKAWFGEATFSVTKKLDLTVGARISDKSGGDIRYLPNDAFRTPDPAIRPQGDPFSYSGIALQTYDPPKPKINTYKFSAAYHFQDRMMAYLTYSEGFTSASSPQVRIGPLSNINSLPKSANARPAANATADPTHPDQVLIDLPVEVISNTEIGIRSDLLDGKLRFNATYFDSTWNGMRINLLPADDGGNSQPFPYLSGDGKGTAHGWEFEVDWAPTDRITVTSGVGLIDTNYIQAGVLTGAPGQSNITGNYPGAPFAYAAHTTATVGVSYRIPMQSGSQVTIVGNYGYTGEYARDAAYQRTLIDANGNPVLEPAYGILNARFVYEPAARNYAVEVWGKNLLDELYVNGGFDTRDIWGYDFSIVGRSREVGVGLSFKF
ncbi:MAG TPA: TonB-dependent receptor [Gammaproteobacteria bacterium]|jgi:outer membrane receptor protein involved in Fe transport|nr:TonB-dependent receptor [Gammaproteobacteria bacterium]